MSEFNLINLPACPPMILDAITSLKSATRKGGNGRIEESGRNDHIFRVGCGMRGRGLSLEEIRGEGMPEAWKGWAWDFVPEERWIEIVHGSLSEGADR